MEGFRPATMEDFGRVKAWLDRPEVHARLEPELATGALKLTQFALLVGRPDSRLFVVGAPPFGVVGLSRLDRVHGRAELWYARGEAGGGLMSEAVAGVVDEAFGALGLHSLRAWVVADHAASIRLLERLGFRAAGALREAFRLGDRWLDYRAFDLLSSEWRCA